MKYLVSVKEINYGGIMVEAKNPEEAKMIAEQEYESGNVFWKNSDLDYVSVCRQKERGDER